jgi:protein-export membrane protein SecD
MSSPKRHLLSGSIIVLGLSILLIAFPTAWKPAILPAFLRTPKLHLGLDLAGGTQLDYRISEAEMEKQVQQLQAEIAELSANDGPPEEIADRESQIQSINNLRRNITESLRTVLERRINSLGVSEAQITAATFGSEKHLLVECPGVIDTAQCMETVGKTITLEFKERFTASDEAYTAEVRKHVDSAYSQITASGRTIADLQLDLQDDLGIQVVSRMFFRDDLPEGLEDLWGAKEGEVLKRDGTYGLVNRGTADSPDVVENEGVFLAFAAGPKFSTGRVTTGLTNVLKTVADESEAFTYSSFEGLPLEKFTPERRKLIPTLPPQTLTGAVLSSTDARILYLGNVRKGEETMEASHILVSYSGAQGASAAIKRTKEEAKKTATELRQRIDAGESFEQLAKASSDDAGSADKSGSLGAFARGRMVRAFEEAAFALQEGDVSGVIESPFGYHIIRSDGAPQRAEDSFTIYELKIQGAQAAQTMRSIYEDVKDLRIERLADARRAEGIFFSFMPTGWKDTPLDGKHFQRATVVSDPVTGLPIVQIVFDKQGGELFYELTKRNVSRPIAIFVGGDLVSAPTVQDEIPGGVAVITGIGTFQDAKQLASDLNTGAIPAPIYLVGQVTVEPTLGQEDLIASIKAGVVGFLLIALYMIAAYRLLGFLAIIALLCYAILFMALLKLPVFFFTDQYIVLTLAGIAGFLMTIGIAIDANVLIFERIKEELKKEKLFKTAVEIGFRRAWAAIWDSNITSLMTALILFIIGTSIVRGFAVTLSLGIPLSMFTAIFITRKLIAKLENTPLKDNMAALGVQREKEASPQRVA